MTPAPRTHRVLAALALGLTIPVSAAAAAQNTTAPPSQPAKPTTPEAPAAPKANLPPAKEVLAKYVDALGGAERIKSKTSRKVNATFEMPEMGMAGEMVILSKAPNMFLMNMNLPGMGDVQQGYNGTVGWALDPTMGAMILEGPQLDQVKRDADFYKDLDLGKSFKTVETTGEEEYNASPCWVVTMTTEEGDDNVALFDKESGLLLALRAVAQSPMGEIPTTTQLLDYKEFDGIKVPVKTEIQMMGMRQVLTIKNVEYDVVEEKAFNVPPAIKSMMGDDNKKGVPPAVAPPTAPTGG